MRFDEYDKCLKVFCHYCENLVPADDTNLTTDDELICRECQFNLTDIDQYRPNPQGEC